MATGSGDTQGKSPRHSDGEVRAIGGDFRVEAGRPSFAVMVAAIGKKANPEPSVTRAFQFPRRVHRVGARLQPDALLDDGVAAAKPPGRYRAVETELGDGAIAVRGNRAIAPSI